MQLRERLFPALIRSWLIAGCAIGFGCSASFHETHYFASRDRETRKPINYYRVTVDGKVSGGDARYTSGYFDTAATEAYFGEFAQPENGQLSPPPEAVEAIDPKGKNRQLVMILSSNSEQVAAGIGAIAQSEELSASVASLVAPNARASLDEAAEALAVDRSRATALVALGDELIPQLPTNASPAQLRAKLLVFLNHTARQLGALQDFESFSEAKRWVAQQRTNSGGMR